LGGRGPDASLAGASSITATAATRARNATATTRPRRVNRTVVFVAFVPTATPSPLIEHVFDRTYVRCVPGARPDVERTRRAVSDRCLKERARTTTVKSPATQTGDGRVDR